MGSGPPIYSVHDEDASMRERVERFVYGLAERIDDLQEAELDGDLAEVERLTRDFVTSAGASGYPLLVTVGETTLTACGDGKADEVRQGISELTDLAQRVRRGSRGAA